MYEIISPGKKIYNYRKLLGIRQEDITGGKITRNLVSYIENEKIKLAPQTAEIIADELIKIAGQKNMDLNITADYLLEDSEQQMAKIGDELLASLKDLSSGDIQGSEHEEEVKDISNVISQWPTSAVKASLLEAIGDFYMGTGDYYSSYLNYVKSYENVLDTQAKDQLGAILLKIIRSLSYNDLYKEAINHAKLFESLDLNVNDDIAMRVYFNKALALKNVGQFSEAIGTFAFIKKHYRIENKSQLFDLDFSIALCHLKMGDFENAKKQFRKLLGVVHLTTEQRVSILNSLIDIEIQQDNTQEAFELINTAFGMLPAISEDDVYKPQILKTLGRSSIQCGDYINAKPMILEALKLSIKAGKYKITTECIELTLDIMLHTNDRQLFNHIKSSIQLLNKKSYTKTESISLKVLKALIKKKKHTLAGEFVDEVLN